MLTTHPASTYVFEDDCQQPIPCQSVYLLTSAHNQFWVYPCISDRKAQNGLYLVQQYNNQNKPQTENHMIDSHNLLIKNKFHTKWPLRSFWNKREIVKQTARQLLTTETFHIILWSTLTAHQFSSCYNHWHWRFSWMKYLKLSKASNKTDYSHTHTQAHACVHACTCMLTHTHTHTRTQMNANTHTHTPTHTYTYTLWFKFHGGSNYLVIICLYSFITSQKITTKQMHRCIALYVVP